MLEPWIHVERTSVWGKPMSLFRLSALCGIIMAAALATGVLATGARAQTLNCSGNPCAFTLDGVASISSPATTVQNPTPTVPMAVTVTATSSFQYDGQTEGYLFLINSIGTTGATSVGSANAGPASGAATVTVTNTGHPTLAGFAVEVGELLRVLANGGLGGAYQSTDGKFSAGAGGAAGAVTMTNSGALTMHGDPTRPWAQGALVLTVTSQGGQGGAVTSNGVDDFGRMTAKDDSNGGNGGNAGDVTVTNNSTVYMGNVVDFV